MRTRAGPVVVVVALLLTLIASTAFATTNDDDYTQVIDVDVGTKAVVITAHDSTANLATFAINHDGSTIEKFTADNVCNQTTTATRGTPVTDTIINAPAHDYTFHDGTTPKAIYKAPEASIPADIVDSATTSRTMANAITATLGVASVVSFGRPSAVMNNALSTFKETRRPAEHLLRAFT